LAGALCAQATPSYDAKVNVPVADVRGGPSDIFPVTGRLRQGQPVHVVSEQNGYFAITPPPGSSSWIDDAALRHARTPTPGKAFYSWVNLDYAPVRLGSLESPTPLPVETVRLMRGTIVHVLGQQARAENKLWWRIEPPPAEVRYVARDALTPPPASSAVVAASPGPGGQSQQPLWAQAEQADRAGDVAKAELLYRQLANQMAQPGGDQELAIRCYNRIDQLNLRRARVATWPARQPAPGMLVNGSPRPGPATQPSTEPAPPPPAGGNVASGPGWLRRSGVQIDGKPVYVLEDNRGQARHYLLAQPGLNLETFVNRTVEVFGAMVQRTDLAGGGYLSVNRLHLLR
jgi:hypothetical protein